MHPSEGRISIAVTAGPLEQMSYHMQAIEVAEVKYSALLGLDYSAGVPPHPY